MVLRTCKKVFAQARYAQIAVLIAFLALSTAILLPNTAIIGQVFVSDNISLADKFAFLGTMYGSLVTNFSVLSAVSTVLISGLFGVNTALLTYYIRRRQTGSRNRKGNTAGFLGAVSGVFGIGCAACGSVIVSGLLALVGATGLLALLPLHGAEFGLIGVLLLMYSVYQLSRRINDPLVCSI
jgi:hypothetical protein